MPHGLFVNECVVKHYLDRTRSWMVGDKPVDIETGLNAGVTRLSSEERSRPNRQPLSNATAIDTISHKQLCLM
jgi:histidinol phosphatase-like enzyme